MTRVERAVLALVVLLTVLAGVGRYVSGIPHLVAFILAALALAGQAWTVSFATEQIGMRFGPAPTGVLQSTIGNLPEFFVVLFALQARDTTVAETALIGSILVNALLVLGLVLITGSARERDGVMRFNTGLPNDTATLLLIASLTIVLIALVTGSHDTAGMHVETISIVGASAMLSSTGSGCGSTCAATRSQAGAGEERRALRCARPSACWSRPGSASAFVSDWFVDALEPTIHQLHMSQSFAGLVIVAIAGNAVENAAGIYLAYRGKHDLAISVVKNSVAQIAAFLYPLMVLVSLRPLPTSRS